MDLPLRRTGARLRERITQRACPAERARRLLGVRISNNPGEAVMRFWTEALIVATAAVGAWLLTGDADPSLPRMLATGEHLPALFLK